MKLQRWTMTIIMLAAGALPLAAGTAIFSRAYLSDLSGAADPTDGAWAVASATVAEGTTVVAINLKGLDPVEAGRVLGAHVHVGSCIAGNGGAAGGHYNAGGGISADTEVWLDFEITGGGTGHAQAVVPFEIDPGSAHSIVIHNLPTDSLGLAGARLACLPLEF